MRHHVVGPGVALTQVSATPTGSTYARATTTSTATPWVRIPVPKVSIKYSRWLEAAQAVADERTQPPTMFQTLLKLYTMYMTTGVTSPMPHIVGPPGSGKSTVFQQLADALGVQLHVVNVSRLSPLGLEGLEMPNLENSSLKLLISELWTKAEEGDIYLFDEFLRGFPEVYNGLLDIFTAREVAGFRLPKIFIAGASNSTIAYDPALEDRLLHIPVEDPRHSRSERMRLSQILIDRLGLMPDMLKSAEMHTLMAEEVLPTFDMLDHFDSARGHSPMSPRMKGQSLRKLIGQVQLREISSSALQDLIDHNNREAMAARLPQYVVLLNGQHVLQDYESRARGIVGHAKLTPVQSMNLEMNLQLIDMAKAMKANQPTQKEEEEDEYIQF